MFKLSHAESGNLGTVNLSMINVLDGRDLASFSWNVNRDFSFGVNISFDKENPVFIGASFPIFNPWFSLLGATLERESISEESEVNSESAIAHSKAYVSGLKDGLQVDELDDFTVESKPEKEKPEVKEELKTPVASKKSTRRRRSHKKKLDTVTPSEVPEQETVKAEVPVEAKEELPKPVKPEVATKSTPVESKETASAPAQSLKVDVTEPKASSQVTSTPTKSAEVKEPVKTSTKNEAPKSTVTPPTKEATKVEAVKPKAPKQGSSNVDKPVKAESAKADVDNRNKAKVDSKPVTEIKSSESTPTEVKSPDTKEDVKVGVRSNTPSADVKVNVVGDKKTSSDV